MGRAGGCAAVHVGDSGGIPQRGDPLGLRGGTALQQILLLPAPRDLGCPPGPRVPSAPPAPCRAADGFQRS